MKKAVFLDRDGILNKIIMREETVGSPRVLAELEIIPEAHTIVEVAKQLDYLTIVATNQPDVERGKMASEDLTRIHETLMEVFDLDGIETCTASDNGDPRRKPNPGMLLEASRKYGIELKGSFFVGDAERDVLAGKRAGVRTILLQTDYNKRAHGMAEFNCNSFGEIAEVLRTGGQR